MGSNDVYSIENKHEPLTVLPDFRQLQEYNEIITNQMSGTINHGLDGIEPKRLHKLEIINSRVILTSRVEAEFAFGGEQFLRYQNTSSGGRVYLCGSSNHLPISVVNGNPQYENTTIDYLFTSISDTEMQLEIKRYYSGGQHVQTYTVPEPIMKS